MESLTEKSELDYLAICERAIGTLARRGVCHYIERDELVSVGYLAIISAGVTDEALAVTVARRAMFNLIDHSAVRSSRAESVSTPDGETPYGDEWDALIYSRAKIAPANHSIDVWEAMKALPPKQFTVIMRIFWGNETQAAVAEDMGVSQPMVVKILNAAKKNLRQVINGKPQLITLLEGKMIG